MKILMVCLGNICRSPIAEGILQDIIDTKGLDWQVDSAGTGNWHVGNAPDGRAVETAKNHGVLIQHQKARQFSTRDFANFDLILAMDRSNYKDIIKLASSPADKEKVRLILEYSRSLEQDVPDPYWDDDGFEKVYHLLKDACDLLVGHYSSELINSKKI